MLSSQKRTECIDIVESKSCNSVEGMERDKNIEPLLHYKVDKRLLAYNQLDNANMSRE